MASQQALQWSRPLFVVGTGLSAFISGSISTVSLVTIPTLLTQTSNAALLTSWRHLFITGGAIVRPLAITAAITHAVNAYISLDSSSNYKDSKWLLAASLSTIAIVPFTLVFIMPTNYELLKQEEVARGTMKSVETGALNLIKKWSSLNLIRSTMPALGALAAFMTL